MVPAAPKGAILAGRLLWTFSAASRRLGEPAHAALLAGLARCIRLEAAAEGASFAGMLPAAFAGALSTAAAAPAVLFVLDGSRLFRKPKDEPWRRSLV